MATQMFYCLHSLTHLATHENLACGGEITHPQLLAPSLWQRLATTTSSWSHCLGGKTKSHTGQRHRCELSLVERNVRCLRSTGDAVLPEVEGYLVGLLILKGSRDNAQGQGLSG